MKLAICLTNSFLAIIAACSIVALFHLPKPSVQLKSYVKCFSDGHIDMFLPTTSVENITMGQIADAFEYACRKDRI